MNWDTVKRAAYNTLSGKELPDEYKQRLDYEFYEIEKQGANEYWLDNIRNKETWDENPSGLILPWLLGMTPIDPIINKIPHKTTYQTDYPDIDTDFIPIARAAIKEYATKKYVHVCSVGSWVTYQPKSAMQDVARALGADLHIVTKLTTSLPEDFDELTLEDHDILKKNLNNPDKSIREEAHRDIAKYKEFYEYQKNNLEIIEKAFQLVGKIRAQGTHAGGLIIADRPIDNIVPLSYLSDNWTSQWTEGKRTQLSKFGLVKFDILGVKTLYYIWQACNLIKNNYDIVIDWSEMDPTADIPYIGHEIHSDGSRHIIEMNDRAAIAMCNELRTESVFQIETSIQKGIIKDGKVKDFWDIVAYNALGRPGPIDCIPEYIKNRDDNNKKWAQGENEDLINILEKSYGVICYQEQLTAIWITLAKFTVPEAEDARKIIAKKWVDKLPQVQKKWMEGATKTIGKEAAEKWWAKMIDFGRYAFNLSHAVAYSIITMRCLYLKAHYAPQWWAAVMTECHQKKLNWYMSAAKMDGIKFGVIDINFLSNEFIVKDGKMIPGLKAVKGIGEKAAASLVTLKGPFNNIDDIVAHTGKNKAIYERLIGLGAFDSIHQNRRALWMWYQYKYCSDATEDGVAMSIAEYRKKVDAKFTPPDEEIERERNRRFAEYVRFNPKRKKMPPAIKNYKPRIGHRYDTPSREQVMSLYQDDYTIGEMLLIEKKLLGYYWSSPLRPYRVNDENTILNAKQKGNGIIEVVINEITEKQAKSGSKFYVLNVTDGVQFADIAVWSDVYCSTDRSVFRVGVGIKMSVEYNEQRNGFKISPRTRVIPLLTLNQQPEPDLKPEDELVMSKTEDPLW